MLTINNISPNSTGKNEVFLSSYKNIGVNNIHFEVCGGGFSIKVCIGTKEI